MNEYIGIVGVALAFLAVLYAGTRSERTSRYFGSTGYVMRGEDLCGTMRTKPPRSRDPLYEWRRELEAGLARRQRNAERAKTTAWWGAVLIGAAIVVAVYLVARGRL